MNTPKTCTYVCALPFCTTSGEESLACTLGDRDRADPVPTPPATSQRGEGGVQRAFAQLFRRRQTSPYLSQAEPDSCDPCPLGFSVVGRLANKRTVTVQSGPCQPSRARCVQDHTPCIISFRSQCNPVRWAVIPVLQMREAGLKRLSDFTGFTRWEVAIPAFEPQHGCQVQPS